MGPGASHVTAICAIGLGGQGVRLRESPCLVNETASAVLRRMTSRGGTAPGRQERTAPIERRMSIRAASRPMAWASQWIAVRGG